MEGLVLLLVFGAFAFAIAHFLGSKRQIGFGWSFFFCLFLSPIIGFIVTMLSRKYYDPNPAPSTAKTVWGWILIIFFSLSLIGQFLRLANSQVNSGTLNAFFLCIGFIGLGAYLLELAKGKHFNTEALTKVE